jgi:hypothetical protein
MTTALWIVAAVFGIGTAAVVVIYAAGEVSEWRRCRARDRAFTEIAAARAEREKALRPTGRVPRDRAA